MYGHLRLERSTRPWKPRSEAWTLTKRSGKKLKDCKQGVFIIWLWLQKITMAIAITEAQTDCGGLKTLSGSKNVTKEKEKKAILLSNILAWKHENRLNLWKNIKKIRNLIVKHTKKWFRFQIILFVLRSHNLMKISLS